jgi:hypothetical protein
MLFLLEKFLQSSNINLKNNSLIKKKTPLDQKCDFNCQMLVLGGGVKP